VLMVRERGMEDGRAQNMRSDDVFCCAMDADDAGHMIDRINKCQEYLSI
jgi:hypothetical protein